MSHHLPFKALRFSTCLQIVLGLGALVALTTTARAATGEQRCLTGRYKAAAKYASCERKVLALLASDTTVFDSTFQPALVKCRNKYAAAWSKLQRQGAGTTCDNPRFVDNGDGTVTDRLTRLQWEKKTDDSSIHDTDTLYGWSAGGAGTSAADGSAFTAFLATLNNGACFAGHCDWRLPTRDELQTILLAEPYVCATSPCIDETLFGPTKPARYWTATTDVTDASDPANQSFAWIVIFDSGYVYTGFKGNIGGSSFARAVRSGL